MCGIAGFTRPAGDAQGIAVGHRRLTVIDPLAGLFRRVEIERLLAAHMAQRQDHRKRIWSLDCLFRFAATARRAAMAAAA